MPSRPLTAEQLVATVAATPDRAKHLAALPLKSRNVLEAFAKYLVEREAKSPKTAQAYKSFVAKAMVEGGASTNQIKSAVLAFARYAKAPK